MVFLWASQCHIPGGDGSAGPVPPGVGTPSRSQPGMGLGEPRAWARKGACHMSSAMFYGSSYGYMIYIYIYIRIYGSYMDHIDHIWIIYGSYRSYMDHIWIIYGSYMESPFLIINHHKSTLPSGKRLHNYGNSTHFSWDNSLFLWPCSIAFCMYTRGYIYIHIHVYMDHIGDPGGTWWLTIGVLIFPSPSQKKKTPIQAWSLAPFDLDQYMVIYQPEIWSRRDSSLIHHFLWRMPLPTCVGATPLLTRGDSIMTQQSIIYDVQ